MPDERRKKIRVHFNTPVVLKTDSSNIAAEVNSKDISIKGMYIHTKEKIPPGLLCTVEIVLTGASSRLALAIDGVITRQDESGLGVEFKFMSIDSYYHLKNIVAYNSSGLHDIEEGMPGTIF